jgi:hypothetical protein
MANIAVNQQYRVAKGILTRRNHDGAVLIMSIHDGATLYKLQGLCADAWELLADHHDIASILSKLQENYLLPEERFIADLQSFLEEFEGLGYLERY